MKISESDKKRIEDSWGDWEDLHYTYDDIVLERLRELDPEFVEEIEELTREATFWYA